MSDARHVDPVAVSVSPAVSGGNESRLPLRLRAGEYAGYILILFSQLITSAVLKLVCLQSVN